MKNPRIFFSLFHLLANAVFISQLFVFAQQPTPPRKTLFLPNGAKPIPKGKYEPNWDSIKKNYKTPGWFLEAKFGIMMHWGLYSVPAYQSRKIRSRAMG